MKTHTDCSISKEILRKEAQATMVPDDPNYGMHDKLDVIKYVVKENKLKMINDKDLSEKCDESTECDMK